jgi:hypothetical protein
VGAAGHPSPGGGAGLFGVPALTNVHAPQSRVKNALSLAAISTTCGPALKPLSMMSLVFKVVAALRALGWHIENDGGHNKAKTTQWTITAPKAAGGSEGDRAGHGKSLEPPKTASGNSEYGSAGQAG